jgi:hypothetical protein
LLRKRFVLPIVVVLTAAFACLGASTASGATGAAVVNSTQCNSDETGTFCLDLRYESRTRTNPAGVFVFESNGNTLSTFVGSGALAGCSSSDAVRFHNVFVLVPHEGTQHDILIRDTFVSAFQCSGVGVVCTTVMTLHFANGILVFDRQDGSCEPTLTS